jgi:hypothetical protein
MKKNILLITAFACAAVLAGGAVGFAVGLYQIREPDPPVRGGSLCRFAADPDSNSRPIGNDTFSRVSTLTMSKPCRGPVLGEFTAELFATVDGTMAEGAMIATCIGTGGFSNPCTDGEVVVPDPEGMLLAYNLFETDPTTDTEAETRSLSAVWRDLRPGRWRFDVYVAGDGPGDEASLHVRWRVFHVEAFSGLSKGQA